MTAAGRPGHGLLFVTPAVLYTLVFFVVPLVLTVVMSTYDYPLLGTPAFTGAHNYAAAAGDALFRQSVVFTAGFTVLVTVLTVVLGFALAYLVHARTLMSRICRLAVFLPVVIGMPAAALLWLSLYNDQVGLFDAVLLALGVVRQPVQWLASAHGAFLAVVVLTIWKSVGFAMMLYLTGIQSIPDEVHEAARIDGAGRWQTLRFVLVPLLRRTTGMVTLLTVTASFLLFDQVYVLTRGGPFNSTVSVVYWIYSSAFVRFRLGYAATLAIVLLVVLLVFSAIQLSAFRERER